MDEHLLLLARHLDRGQFELLVLTHPTDGPQTHLLAERADIRAIPAPYPPHAGALTRLAALRALYRNERIDLLHLHSPAAGGQWVPVLAARLTGVPVAATYHQVQAIRLPVKTRLINYVIHRWLIASTVAVSRGVKASLARAAGLPERRITVIHNGIDRTEEPRVAAGSPALPARAPGEVRIGYFGRLSPEKGLAVVLQALANLAVQCPQAHTLIVGDGPERERLEAITRLLAIEDRVSFLGFRPDARALMAEVDIIVHTPVYEGFGIVVLEAMAAGRPVVVNDSPGGLTEIVTHGETGLVVPANSPSALAAALAQLCADPEARRRLGQQGLARYEERFSARAMAERVAALYERSLRGRSTAGPGSFEPAVLAR